MENNENTQGTQEVRRGRRPGLPWDDVDALLARVCDDRYEITMQSAFLQVKGPNGHRLYIAKQETIRRIDLAFTPPDVPTIKPRKHNGSIERELDTADDAALTHLEQVLVWMASAPAVVVEKRRAFTPKLVAVAQRRNLTPEQEAKEREERRERIQRVAREKGVDVSPNADI